MSTVHVPAMSGFQDDGVQRMRFCISCNEKLPCKCIWESIRELQANIESINEKFVNNTLSDRSIINELFEKFNNHRLWVATQLEELSDHDERINDLELKIQEKISDVMKMFVKEDCKLENEILSITDQIKGLRQHIENTHDMINMEDRITASDVLSRIAQLESNNLGQQLDPKVWYFVNERLDKIESKTALLDFNNWMSLITDLEKKFQVKIDEMMEIFKCNWATDQYHKSKKPHKCPVCEGEGLIKGEVLLSMPPQWPQCKSCEGKGIVWG